MLSEGESEGLRCQSRSPIAKGYKRQGGLIRGIVAALGYKQIKWQCMVANRREAAWKSEWAEKGGSR